MPYGDRTGPMGQGPMTGRGAGYCAGYAMPGNANPIGGGFGRGRGGGWGRGGFGYRHNFYGPGAYGRPYAGWSVPWPGAAAPSTEEEMSALKSQADILKKSLEDIQRRLKELDETKSE